MKIQITLILCLVLISNTLKAQVNLSSGLVAYYPFNGTFNDSTGNGNIAQAYGGIGFTADRWGNAGFAANFDGIDDYILIPPAQQLTPDSSFTLALRFLTYTNNPDEQTIISKSDWAGTAPGNNVNHIQYHIGFSYPGFGVRHIYFGTEHDNDCNTINILPDDYIISQDTVVDSVWNCLLTVFDHGVKSIYLNGVLTARDTITGMINNYTVDPCDQGYIKLGAWWVGGNEFFHGIMDEVRIYNRALNPQEIDSFCNFIVTPPTGIDFQTAGKAKFSIYPNPANKFLNVQLDGDYSSLVIYNKLGQTVKTMPVTKRTMQVDMEALPSGNYYLRISGKNGVLTAQFIK